jgi:pimeloyl-ACP methyl ester carboxylesterase
MSVILLVLAAILGVHLVAAVIATRVIAARIEAENPPGGIIVPVEGGAIHLYDLAPREAPEGPPILLLHGATSNARDMLLALGGALSRRHRVIIPDRPGHGWSAREGGRANASPARQATLIAEALDARGIGKVVVVGYSLAGSVATNLALDHADRTAGLVLISAATHPWPGGINWYYRLAAMPLLGDLFVDTVMTPIGAYGLEVSIAGAFGDIAAPADYAKATAAALVLRPNEFRWNAQDVADLKAFVTAQAPRYGAIRVPTAIIASDEDRVVSTDIHSRAIARQIPGARLTVLHGKGHLVHYTAKDVVLGEIERVAREVVAASRSAP